MSVTRGDRNALQQALAEETQTLEALSDLTGREREVLALLAEGRSNPEIAEALSISVHTANNHVRNILDKLGVNNRVQAAVLWERYVRGSGAGEP